MTATDRDRNQGVVVLQTIEAHLVQLVALAQQSNALAVHNIVVPQILGCRHTDRVPEVLHAHGHLISPLSEPDRLALWSTAAQRIVALEGAATVSAAKKLLKARIAELQGAAKGSRP